MLSPRYRFLKCWLLKKDISQQLQNRAVDLIIVRKIRTRELPTREGVRRTPEDDLVFKAMGDYEVQYRLKRCSE